MGRPPAIGEMEHPLFHPGRVLLLAALIVFALQALVAIADRARLETGGLLGPDSYMRALRVLELREGGAWYDPVSERTNAPHGETLHWGRPLDAVLAAGAALAAPVAAPRESVYLSALVIGPLIAFLIIPAWSWGTRPFLGNGAFLMTFVLLAFAPFLLLNLKIGRADHHGLLALLFLLQLGAAFRLATRTGRTNNGLALLLGVIGGLALWVNVTALVSQLMIAAVLALRYLRQDARRPREICFYTLGLVAMATVALALERPPPDWLSVDFKRLSIVHWTLAAAAATTWWAIHCHARSRPAEAPLRARLLTLLIGAAVPLAVMTSLFPSFFLGPLAGQDAEIVYSFLAVVNEFRPLFPATTPDLARFIVYLGPVLIGLGFILFDYRQADDSRRGVYDVLLVGMAIYVPMALWIGRFALYAQILGLAPWAIALTRIMRWGRTVRIGSGHIPLRGFAVVAAVVGPFLLSLTTNRQAILKVPQAEPREWQAIGAFLTSYARRTGDTTDTGRILFTYLFKGPEMAWRTPYDVVGAPYDNAASIADTYRIFRAKTDAAAKQAIDARGIELILYCREEPENAFYRQGKDGSLLSRIENGHIPGWLQPVPLPPSMAKQFKLFRIARS